MKGRNLINTYFSMLIVTILASLATVAIVETATTNVVTTAMSGTEATYVALQRSILQSRLSSGAMSSYSDSTR